MKLHHLALAAALTATVAVVALAPHHVAPANLYPDSHLTPGKWDTQDPAAIQATYNGQTYSQSHRNVPQAEKDQVYAAYEKLSPGITAYCNAAPSGANQRCEVDHFCPVGIGCSNDAQNLWIQRADTTYQNQPMGFHEKDKLETWGIAQVKAGKLTPRDFDTCILSDWVQCYLKNIAKSPTFGSHTVDTEGE